MTTTGKPMTGEELQRLPHDGRRYELLDGVLVEMPPNNGDHDDVRMRTTVVVGQFFLIRDEGRFFSGDTGYYLRRNPDRVRAPDLSYFVPERAPARGQRGFF